ncbi:MAG: type I glyceraldehyde-3-phosphate dehydrogenase [Actinomycetota bacterium]|nr:type I glyceraldehyde-3-phosphate dehydrogenase [Actinomycetota bacterium]
MSKTKVAINGFGRIGRTILRIILLTKNNIEVVAINDLGDYDTLSYLLKYDTVFGVLDKEISIDNETLVVGDNKHNIKLISQRDPSLIPWSELDIDIVIEATGTFADKESLQKHIEAGAKKVVLTVPPKDEIDATIVFGVNEEILEPSMKLISNASCTTNCLAPIAKVLDENFGIVSGLMTTVHAYTNDQALAETTHKDFRRGRSATQNIIPTTTGAAKAVGMVLPSLNGKLDGLAMRVPVPDGSIIDLVAEVQSSTTVKEINDVMKKASEGRMKEIIEYSSVPLASSDIIGNPASSIFDASSTQVLGNNLIKVVAWYDNEWGYSNRIVDLVKLISKRKKNE